MGVVLLHKTNSTIYRKFEFKSKLKFQTKQSLKISKYEKKNLVNLEAKLNSKKSNVPFISKFQNCKISFKLYVE